MTTPIQSKVRQAHAPKSKHEHHRHLGQARFARVAEKRESELTKRVPERNFKGGSLGKI
jgi:hypothetical protein